MNEEVFVSAFLNELDKLAAVIVKLNPKTRCVTDAFEAWTKKIEEAAKAAGISPIEAVRRTRVMESMDIPPGAELKKFKPTGPVLEPERVREKAFVRGLKGKKREQITPDIRASVL